MHLRTTSFRGSKYVLFLWKSTWNPIAKFYLLISVFIYFTEHCSRSALQQNTLSQWGAARCLAQARYCLLDGLVDGRLEFMKPEPWKGPLSGCVRVLLLHGHRWLCLQPEISSLCTWLLGQITYKKLSHVYKEGGNPTFHIKDLHALCIWERSNTVQQCQDGVCCPGEGRALTLCPNCCVSTKKKLQYILLAERYT